MSGQLGDLVISISADMARFRADMGKAQQVTQSTMQQMQADVSRGIAGMQSSLAAVSKGFAAITAVAAGGAMFSSFISSTKEWNGEVMKLSKTIGMTVSEASAYNVALRIAGVDVETATSATAKLTKTLTTNEDAFRRHGIATRDASGKLLPMPQIIGNTYEALGKLESGLSRNAVSTELIGKSWVQLGAMAKITNPLLAEARQLSDDLGLTLDGKTSEAVKKYGMEMNKLKLVHEGFKVMVGREVIGPLGEIEKQITKILSKDHALRDTITFMAHPIDFTRKQWREMSGPERIPMPDRPAATGEQYDPEAAAKAAAAAAEKEAAARAAAAAALQKENEYVKTYNQLQDERVKRQIQENGELSATEKKVAEIRIHYDNLLRQYPNHAAELKRQLELDTQNERVLGQQVEQRKLANAELKESIRLLEEATKDSTGFAAYGQGLNVDFGMKQPKRPNYDFSGKPLPGGKFSLNGPAESSLFGGKNDEVTETQRQKDELLKIEQRYTDQVLAMKLGAASQSVEIIKNMAGESKVIAISALALQKALSTMQIMMNTEVAASAALLPPPVGLGPVAGQALAGEIRALGYASAGLNVIAGGVEAGQIAARATGGPVQAGKTYLIGEKGPELMTVGASGFVTPNERIGGGNTYAPVINIDARHSRLERQEIRAIVEESTQQSVAAVYRNMERGGSLAHASGRMRG